MSQNRTWMNTWMYHCSVCVVVIREKQTLFYSNLNPRRHSCGVLTAWGGWHVWVPTMWWKAGGHTHTHTRLWWINPPVVERSLILPLYLKIPPQLATAVPIERCSVGSINGCEVAWLCLHKTWRGWIIALHKLTAARRNEMHETKSQQEGKGLCVCAERRSLCRFHSLLWELALGHTGLRESGRESGRAT